MPDPRKTITTKRLPLTDATAAAPLAPLRAGMPAMDSIHDTVKFAPTRGGPKYSIIRTTETDGYETSGPAIALTALLKGKKAPTAAALAAAVKAKLPTGDTYAGSDRKAAKLSIAQAPVKNFNDLSNLITSLTPDDKMTAHKPLIKTSPSSNRVAEENRNVGVAAFLYAASREADNDFHLIVGRDPKLAPEMYMTMEVSGLPPQNSPAFVALNATRGAFKKFFGKKLPAFTYDFYNPPIPVAVEGSLFFDATHRTGQRPGPQSLKSRMPTIWEVHPLTSIKLGP